MANSSQKSEIADNPPGPREFIGRFSAEDFADIEFDSPEKIRELQNRLLTRHVRYVAQNSPYYRGCLERLVREPDSAFTVEDLGGLPCVDKHVLSERPDDFLAARPNEIADCCLSSATTSDRPSLIPQTASDLSRLAYNEQRAFHTAGLRADDAMMVCAALDRCFMAGLAYFLGGARLGMRMIRAGAGDAAQHWQTILATRPTVLVGVPSLFRRIAEHALAEGGRPSKAGITRLIGIGEPTRDASLEMLPSARLVEEFWGAPLYSTYASTEIATSFAECEARQGGHLRPELLVVEIVDDAGRQVPPGETGEVVVTPLGVRGMPLLRFRTGDVSFLIDAPCSCGRNSPRLGPILGRKNQMLKYKGTTIFPNAILAALEGRKDVVGAYVEARRNPDGTDRVVVHASVSNPGVGAGTLAEEIRARLRVAPELVIEDAETLNRKVYGSGKRKRATFFDLRREKEIEAE